MADVENNETETVALHSNTNSNTNKPSEPQSNPILQKIHNFIETISNSKFNLNCGATKRGAYPYISSLFIIIYSIIYLSVNTRFSTDHKLNPNFILNSDFILKFVLNETYHEITNETNGESFTVSAIEGWSDNSFYAYFTYCFISSSTKLFLKNLFLLLLVWPVLEIDHDNFRPTIIFLFGVITAALCVQARAYWTQEPTAYMGCAGGAYALITAHFSNIAQNWQQLTKNQLCRRFLFYQPLINLAFYDMYRAYQDHLIFNSNDENISMSRDSARGTTYFGHLGGSVTGLLLGFYVLRNYHDDGEWERLMKIFGLVVYLIFLVCLVIWVNL